MEHLLLKAATSAVTDQGIFEAVISSSTIDREKDIVSPAGMVRALKRWVPTGKMIPLAWQHSTAAEDIIGHVDPTTARVVGNEVVATGFIDQDIPRGKEAWRLVKSGVLGFSFGYLIPTGGALKRTGGGRNINELDVFEITATPTPMHNDTRVLGYKAELDGVATILEQYQEASEVAREARLEDEQRRLGEMPPAPPATVQPTPPPIPDADEQWRKAVALEREVAHETREREAGQLPDVPPAPPAARQRPRPQVVVVPDAAEQRRKAVALEREIAEEDRAHEAQTLPTLDAPPPAPTPPAPAPVIPDAEEQWRKAVALEREQQDAQRSTEERQLPPVPPAPAVSEPAPDADPPALETQWERATALEREQQRAARAAEERGLPEIPPPPAAKAVAEPPESPGLEAQWQRATALEREQLKAIRAAEERQLPDVPPPPSVRRPPEPEVPNLETQWQRATSLERELARDRRRAEEEWLAGISTKSAGDVGPHARSKLSSLIKYYMSKPHPFTECVRDNTKRFGPDGADRVCATLKDIGAGTTHWRHGGGHGKAGMPMMSGATDMPQHGTAGPGTGDGPDWAQILYDAANGNLEGLIAMWHDWCARNGDDPDAPDDETTEPKAIDARDQDRKAARLEREARRAAEEDVIGDVDSDAAAIARDKLAQAQWLLEGQKAGEDFLLKAVRRGADGAIDLPFLRKAIAELSQSNLPPDVMDRCLREAQHVLDVHKPVDGDAHSRSAARASDPQRAKAQAVALEFASDGLSERKPPRQQKAPSTPDLMPLGELRRRMRQEMFTALTGVDDS